MQNDNELLMEKYYQEVLLQEKIIDIFRNLGVFINRHFRCKQGEKGVPCPNPDDLVNKIREWVITNKASPYAPRISQIVNTSEDADKILANLRFNLEYLK
jgi:hypothetical protein